MTALKGAAIDRFIKQPAADTVFILIYGPDAGLVKERGRQLIKAFEVDADDPFAVSRLEEGDLEGDPARLADEALAISLTAPRRVVWITGAGQATAAALEPILEDPPEAAVIIAEAGELRPAAKLRKLGEKGARAVALACYADETFLLERLIDEEVRGCGLSIADDAREVLLMLLGADRALSRQEIAKLCTYAHGRGRIEREDVEAVCGDATAEAIDRTVDSVLDGNLAGFDRAFTKAIDEGAAPTRLLWAAGQQLWALIKIDAARRSGRSASTAVAGLRPPVHFKRRDRLIAQAARWDRNMLTRAEAIVHEADAACRSQGAPQAALARQALLSLAGAARSGGTRAGGRGATAAGRAGR